jgi:hypothetical protein
MAAGSSSHPQSKSAASGSSTGSGNATISCPSGSEVNSDLGLTLSGPAKKSGGGLDECDYDNQTTSVTFIIAITKVPGLTPSALKAVYASQAKAQKVPDQADPGLGDAAYSFTQDDASTNASGKPTAVLGILFGDTQIAMTGEVSLGGMETLAAAMLKH